MVWFGTSIGILRTQSEMIHNPKSTKKKKQGEARALRIFAKPNQTSQVLRPSCESSELGNLTKPNK